MAVETTTGGYKPVSDVPDFLDIKSFVLVVTCFALIGLAAWVSLAKIDSATIARGQIQVESHRKTVKILESGLVKRLLVSEGDHVVAGQALIELDATRIDANVDILRQRYVTALAQLARFQAQAFGNETIDFPKELLDQFNDLYVGKVINTETKLFTTQVASLSSRRSVLRNRIEQTRTRISANKGQIQATKEQITLIEEELRTVKFLLEKELIQRTRYLTVKRQHVSLKARLSELYSTQSQLKQSIGATNLELLDLEESARNEALTNIGILESRLNELREETGSAQNVQALHTIKAPQSGNIVNLKVYNVGAIVYAGEALMDIVPDDDRLIVDTEISANDIDDVSVGMRAKIRLSALNARTTPHLEGEVVLISADLVSPPDAKSKFYGAMVVIAPESLEKLVDVKIASGMQVEVYIVRGERTVIDYLLTPVSRALETAMQEP